MGAFLDKPKVDKSNESGVGNGLRYALADMQGWRVEMEDAHCAISSLPVERYKDWSYFAVFDGHAGSRVSTYCAAHLLDAIITNDEFLGQQTDGRGKKTKEPLIDPKTLPSDPAAAAVFHGIRTGFLRLDNEIRSLPEMSNGDDKSGSTAVCVFVSADHIFFANCGDSRAVLSRNGRLAYGTQDHKPVNPGEKERIQNAGGSVMIQRVNGSLAVSRALGDFEYKNVAGKAQCEQLVSPEPEIHVEKRMSDDEFFILACDGVWDVMSNDELCDFVRNRMCVMDNLSAICNLILDTCLYKGSRDNMSIVIVAFSGAPQVSDAGKKREAELDARLEAKVKDIVRHSSAEASQLPYVMHMLATEDIEGLPPGGGLISKRSTVEEILNRINPNAATKNDE